MRVAVFALLVTGGAPQVPECDALWEAWRESGEALRLAEYDVYTKISIHAAYSMVAAHHELERDNRTSREMESAITAAADAATRERAREIALRSCLFE